MITKSKSIFFLFTGLLFLIYGISFLVNQIFQFQEKWQETSYSFFQVFSFFGFTSFILLIIHYIIYKKSKDQLGFVFLITLTLKVVLSFLFVKGITNVFEKHYIITYFFVFLIIDVWLTIRLLNNYGKRKAN